MNILIISSFYPPYIGGGAEIMLQIQVQKFLSKGHNVTVLSLSNDKKEKLENDNNFISLRFPIPNIYWHLNPKANNKYKRLVWHIIDIYNLKAKNLIKQYLNDKVFDIAICHNLAGWSISVWSALKSKNIPIIQVIHDYYFLCTNSNMYKNNQPCESQCLICKAFTWPVKKSSSLVNEVVCVSNTVLQQIKQYSLFKNADFHVIYNAKDIPISPPSNQNLWNGEEPLIIGYIGTISPAKGVHNLIKAFRKRTIKAQLYIAGKFISKEYEKILKAEAKNDPDIHFLGYCNSDTFFKQIHIAVFPSIWKEPFGLVAIESCAHSVPCIVPSWGGLHEIIQDNVNGFYCDSKQPDSILKKIETFYYNYNIYQRLVSNTYNSITKFLNTDSMIEQYEQLIKKYI